MLFIVMMIYEVALGRRTPILILGLVMYAAIFFDYFINKNKNKIMRIIIIISIVCVASAIGLRQILAQLNYENLEKVLQKASLLRKFYYFGFESGRLNIFGKALKLAPHHMFGGKEISAIIEWDIHDLWFDTFDYAGIVPFIILALHSIMSIFVFVKFYKNKSISKEFKFLVSTLFGCIVFQMCIEPIMTGASIFLLCSVIVFALLERLNNIVYNK